MIPEAARSREEVLCVGTAASQGIPPERGFIGQALGAPEQQHLPGLSRIAVIPAKAGIHFDLALSTSSSGSNWIPA